MHPATTALHRGNIVNAAHRSIDDHISMSMLSSERDEEATGSERRHKHESSASSRAEAIYASPKAVGRQKHAALSGEKVDLTTSGIRPASSCASIGGLTGSANDLETRGITDCDSVILDVRAQLNPSYHGGVATRGWDRVRQMLPRHSASSGADAKNTVKFADVLNQVSLLTTAVEAIDRDDAAALLSTLSAPHGIAGSSPRLHEMIVSAETAGGRRCDLLHYAVSTNRTEAALALVTLGGADLVLHSQTSNTITMSTETCLHAAIVQGNERVVRALLEAAGTDKAAEQFALKEMVTVDVDERLSVSALHLAAMHGHVTLIDYLICERGIAVDTPCSTRATAAYLAARRGQSDAVRRLLELGAKTDLADRTQMTFLHYAILSGQNDMVKLCLQSCTMSSCIELWRRSNPLLLAVYQESLEIVRTLLESEDLRTLVNVPTRTFGHTALHIACSSGKDADSAICRALLEAGANALAFNKQGETPFATAILHRKVSSMVAMARYFKPPRRRYFQTVSANGDTVWDYALTSVGQSSPSGGAAKEGGREALAALLEIALYAYRAERDFIDAGEEIDLSAFAALENDSQLTTPLHIAVKKSNVEDIQLLLKYMSTAAVDANGDTFMHVAAREGREDALRCFAVDQSTVNRKNNAGETVLHSACAARQWASARLLLPLADVSATNNRGQTALHELCKNCSPNAYALLRDVVRKTTDDAWEKLSLRDNRGRTPLHLLVARDLQESTEMLIRLFLRPYDSPVPCNVADENGDTPLHVAVSQGRVNNLMAMLTVFGSSADVNSMNCLGRTMLHIAADIGMAEVVEPLLIRGADLTLRDKLGDTPVHAIVRRAGQVPSRTDQCKAMLLEILRHSRHQESLRNFICEDLKSEEINDMRSNALVLLRMLTNSDGLTPLFFAAQVGSKDLFKLMLTLDGAFRLRALPGHEAIDDSAFYDVTDLVPDTVREPPSITVEVKDAVPLKSPSGHDSVPLTQPEMQQPSDEPVSPTKRPNSTAIRRRTQRQQQQHQLGTGSTRRRRQRDGSDAGCRSLVEFILQDVGSRAHLLDVTPLDELTSDYWAPYKIIFLALMIVHIVAMGLFSWVSLDALWEAKELLNCSNNAPNASSVTSIVNLSLPSVSPVMIWPLLIIVINIISLVGYVRRKYDCRGLAADARRSLSYVRDTQAPMFWLLGVVFSWVSVLWYALHVSGSCAQDYALCVALITGWLYTIHFTQGIRSVHHFALVLGRILMRDIWQFAVIFIFVLLGYSFGFHAMTISMPLQRSTYSRYGMTVFKVFAWGAGMGDFYQETDSQYADAGKYKEFVEAVYVTYVIALNIILLNMLIAVMNDSYAAVCESNEATWRLGSLRRAISFERRYSRLARLMRRWRQGDIVLDASRKPTRLFLRLKAKVGGDGYAGDNAAEDAISELGAFDANIGGRNLGKTQMEALTQRVLATIKQSLIEGAHPDENAAASPRNANPSAACEDSAKPNRVSVYLDKSITALSHASPTVGNTLV